jgi:hypothetical protein
MWEGIGTFIDLAATVVFGIGVISFFLGMVYLLVDRITYIITNEDRKKIKRLGKEVLLLEEVYLKRIEELEAKLGELDG